MRKYWWHWNSLIELTLDQMFNDVDCSLSTVAFRIRRGPALERLVAGYLIPWMPGWLGAFMLRLNECHTQWHIDRVEHYCSGISLKEERYV